MTLLRAILGRFARFLVRIARRLDPGLATTPRWGMPERMAALRHHYPDAPDHWLELVARRVTVVDDLEPPPPLSEPADQPPAGEFAFPSDRPHERPGVELVAGSRAENRPAVRFKQSDRAPRAALPARPIVAVAADWRAPASKRVRATPTFGAPRIRNRIANLLRLDRPRSRARMLRFRADETPALPAHKKPQTTPPEPLRRDHVSLFPSLNPHRADQPDWIDQLEPPPKRAPIDGEPQPTIERSVPAMATWPAQGCGRDRPNPRFAASDNRWPELPRLSDESSMPGLSASDEAALIAEQIGGTWSA